MKRGVSAVGLLGMFVLLLWLYPNFIHEPLHLVALKLQGADGIIHFNFAFPAHPYIQKTVQVSGIAGGLFFLLLPSFVSVLILIGLWITRKVANAYLHGALAIYLIFDLAVNVGGYGRISSDFHFLVAVPFGIVWGSLLVGLMTVPVLHTVFEVQRRVRVMELIGVHGGG